MEVGANRIVTFRNGASRIYYTVPEFCSTLRRNLIFGGNINPSSADGYNFADKPMSWEIPGTSLFLFEKNKLYFNKNYRSSMTNEINHVTSSVLDIT